MQAAEQAGQLAEIANCLPTFLYFQTNLTTDESWYYCRVDFPYPGKRVHNTFTGSQVATAAEFKKRLLSIAPGGLFTGNAKQLDWLVRHHLNGIKVVETIDFIGYSKEHETYVFNQLAVKAGTAYRLNDEDFFEVEGRAIKSINQGFQLHIGTQAEYRPNWPQLIYQGFGVKGLVATVFWLGTLFAEQIRSLQQSFPFLEIIGEAGAGKTTLVSFLWKLLGKPDEEGWDPAKATAAAVARKFSQVGNLPVVLIEADREPHAAKARGFDWDELKTAYNGRASRARGIKNSGNETHEPPFRGAIVITQNEPVNASEAIAQRLVQLRFDTAAHSAQSAAATDAMNGAEVRHLSFFLRHAVLHEAKIMRIVQTQTPVYAQQLRATPGIRSARIALNYGQLMALADGFNECFKLPSGQCQAVQACLQQLAFERQQALVSDHPIVQQFWELYDYLNPDDHKPVLNHACDPQLIAINLNQFVRVAIEHKQQVPPLSELKKCLKRAKNRKFCGIKPVHSALQDGQSEGPKTVKCWIFLKEMLGE